MQQSLSLLVIVFLELCSALDDQCKDPLFQTHWFGKAGFSTGATSEAFSSATDEDTNVRSLNSIPTVKTGLRLCPQFDGKSSCCSQEFEAEQAKYFGYFRNMIFPSTLHRISEYRKSVADVRRTAAYSAASSVEIEQLHLALERFNPVLHPSVHADCFSAILTYTAGMNCFACRSDWFAYVTQHGGKVLRLHVRPSVCMELWASCEPFSDAARALKQSLLDSALAKQAKRQTEDIDMFMDQQALCNWLHDEVALHPFRRPSESEREAPSLVPITTTLSPATAAAMAEAASLAKAGSPNGIVRNRRLQELSAREIDVLAEGRKSGFAIDWDFVGPSSGSWSIHGCLTNARFALISILARFVLEFWL